MKKLALLLVLSPSCLLAQTPTLPQLYVDTTYPTQSGSTIAVHNGGDLQAALDAANYGDTIVIDAGITLTGNYMLRHKTGQDSNTNWIVITTSGTLPAVGTRVLPANAAQLAKVQSNNSVPVFQTEFAAHHYRLVGLELTKVTDPSPSTPGYEDVSYGIVWVGGQQPGTTNYPAVVSDLPHHIIFDRDYIHGDYAKPHGETYRAIMMNGNYVGVVDSYISNMHSEYIEVQGLEAFNANGPYRIVNNYIEAAGENVIFGGTDPKIANAIPADITFQNNYLAKPLTWNPYDASYAGVDYSVKNLFELKNAVRVLADSNIMEHNWVKSQDGKAVLFTVRDQSGTCNWCAVQDITFTNNIVRHTAGVFNTIAVDYNYPSAQMQRVLIQNNLFYDIGGSEWGDTGGYGIFASVNGGQWPSSPHYTILELTFNHNTAFPPKDVLEMDQGPAATNLVFTNNLIAAGNYGIFGSGAGSGNPAIATYLVSPTWGADVLIGGASTGSYPAGFFLPNSPSDVGFVDYAGGNYALTSGSPYHNAGLDGKDIGVDMTALNTATSCVIAGTCNPPPPLTLVSCVVSPSSSSIYVAAHQSYTVQGTYSDSSTADITAGSSFTSSNTGVATMSGAIAMGVGVGSATITATDGSVSCTSALTVNAAPPAGASHKGGHRKGGIRK